MAEASPLRDYLEKTFGGLREDRSTESYALEFLKTERANLLLSQKRANLTLAATSIAHCASWLKEIMPRAEKLAEEVSYLEDRSSHQTA
jgi:hypothetical protein